MTRIRTALIIGAGIAGPATAMALQKAGLDPVIYEARAGFPDGAGSFLTLAPNGADALRAIDADGPALAAGFPTPAMVLRSGTGKYLGSGPTGLTGRPSQTIKRADLYQALHEEAARTREPASRIKVADTLDHLASQALNCRLCDALRRGRIAGSPQVAVAHPTVGAPARRKSR